MDAVTLIASSSDPSRFGGYVALIDANSSGFEKRFSRSSERFSAREDYGAADVPSTIAGLLHDSNS